MPTRKTAEAIIKGLKEDLEAYGIVFTPGHRYELPRPLDEIAKPLNEMAEEAMGIRYRTDFAQAFHRVKTFFLEIEEAERDRAEAPILKAQRIAAQEARKVRLLAMKRKSKTLSL